MEPDEVPVSLNRPDSIPIPPSSAGWDASPFTDVHNLIAPPSPVGRWMFELEDVAGLMHRPTFEHVRQVVLRNRSPGEEESDAVALKVFLRSVVWLIHKYNLQPHARAALWDFLQAIEDMEKDSSHGFTEEHYNEMMQFLDVEGAAR